MVGWVSASGRCVPRLARLVKRLQGRLTYANVMATIAVFIALGGVGIAASRLPKNSVTAKQIKANAVRASEIKASAVKTSEVANGSLLGTDFAQGQLPTGPTGATGPQGATGATGVQGIVGPTAGAADVNGVALPANPNVGSGASFSLSTQASGQVLVMADIPAAAVNCSPNGDGQFGLYIDGSPISGTSRPFTDGVSTVYDAAGVSGQVAAGSHTISLQANCTGGVTSVTPISVSANRQFSAILLGG